MRRGKIIIGILALLGVALSGGDQAFIFAFTQTGLAQFSASVVLTGYSLLVQAASLPGQAFFGKNVVIPVTVTSRSGPITPSVVRVNILYWLTGPNGGQTSPTVTLPITLRQDPSNPYRLLGIAYIPFSNLTLIQRGGRLQYVFQVPQGGSSTIFSTLPSPISGAPADIQAPYDSAFRTEIITQFCQTIDPSRMNVISAPDLFARDGRTEVSLPPGSVDGIGELCITREDPTLWSNGPGGSSPIAVYTITLNGASLTHAAQLTLSYPSDPDGKVSGFGAKATDLDIYWLGPETIAMQNQTWRLLGSARVDTTLHTVTGTTAHFSTFALFPAGAGGTSAANRPAERIITPNGDHINDAVIFASLVPGQDEVRIFDIRGRRVRHITTTSSAAECGGAFCWDGRDDGGSVVESGVYIYQYTYNGERVSGVVAVAK